MIRLSTIGLAAMILATTASHGEGILWNLPPDGTWLRLEGTYTQTEIRPETATGKLEIAPWIEQVWIKSVGEERAEFRGQMVPCRWLEIKVERGREREGKIDTGLTGLQIYKVLVPEDQVLFDTVDSEGVPVTFIPVIQGYRKIGKGDPKPLDEAALQLYPLAVLVGYYRTEHVVALGEDPEVGIGPVKADKLQSTITIERRSSRTVQETTVWRSKDVPFGIARYTAKIIREVKDDRQSRDEFKPSSEVVVDLKAQESGTDAQSELPLP